MLTALRCLIRKAGLDRNPLRRRVDRIENLLLAGLAVIGLTAAPALAITVAHLSHDAGLRQLRIERSWHQVTAILLQDGAAAGSPTSWDSASVRGRWAASAGHWHTGWVSASPMALAGEHVRIWVDGAGRQTQAPIRRAALDQNVFGLEAFVACCVLSVLWLIAVCVHLAANERRMAGWERDWRVIAPHWTSRR